MENTAALPGERQLAQLPDGSTVLIEGRVAPATPPRRGEMAVYIRQQEVQDDEDEWYWRTIEWVPSSFLLKTQEDMLTVRGRFTLNNATLRETNGRTRYEGFAAGDTITVLAVRTSGQEGPELDAQDVAGGTRDDYIARAGAQLSLLRWILVPFLALMGLLFGGIGLFIWRDGLTTYHQ